MIETGNYLLSPLAGGGFRAMPCEAHLTGLARAPSRVKDFPRLVPLAAEHPTLFTLPAHFVKRSQNLSKRQQRAAYAHTLLELEIIRRGWIWTHGDAFRDPRAFGEYGEAGPRGNYSARKSLHKLKLARDFNLWKPDAAGAMRYQRTTAAHKGLGELWIDLGKFFGWPLQWGGSAGRNDGNHYSYGHDGQW